MFVLLYVWKPLTVTHHLATVNGHRPCRSRDNTCLVCRVTLQDFVIKGFCDFMERSSSLSLTTPSSLVAIVIVVVEMYHI